MRTYLQVAAATVMLTGLTSAGGALAGTASPATRVAPGGQVWVARMPGHGHARPGALAVSPRGGTVFVTGASAGGRAAGVGYETVAYSGATGKKLWTSRYRGPGPSQDHPTAVAVSPDGTTVFVTGYAAGWGTGYDYATVAYNAATGRQLWASRYTSAGNHRDKPAAIAVSPDGATVFVTGTCCSPGDRYATAAYRAATGRQLWASRYQSPGKGATDDVQSMAVSPDGTKVFVTGYRDSQTTTLDYATVAYDAATGRSLWASLYNGTGDDDDLAYAVAVSPDGTKVFVTGLSDGPPLKTDIDYGTIAYNAANGRQLWVSRYNGPSNAIDIATALVVSPDGTKVFVTGNSQSTRSFNDYDYATVAYSTATGRRLWVSRYNSQGNGWDYATSVAVNRAGTKVFVTGYSQTFAVGDNYATTAYSTNTGKQSWASRRNAPANANDHATSVAVSPDGNTVYVTGTSRSKTSNRYRYVTIGYHS